ncbi:hypothetical protein Tco_0836973 [Tanacetum coccineum]
MTDFDPLSDVSHGQRSNINDLLVKLLGKLGDMGLTGSSHSAQATTNDQGHHKSVSLVQNPSVTTGPIAYNIGSVHQISTPTPCPIFYPPVQPTYYYITTGPLGFVPAQQPNPIPQPTSVPPGFAYPTQPTLHPTQLGYSLICPAQQALQPGSMGPTLIPGLATTLPHAFVVGTLHDPSSGAWNMDTGASSHLNDYVTNLSDVFNSCMYPSVSVGNGHSIPITNTGHSILPTSVRPLHLNNVLITLNIVKKLIFVRQFVRDNNCTIEFVHDSSGTSPMR